MPTPTKGARLGGGPAHERLMLANLAQSLFRHGRITTTVTRAKRLRPFAERLVTFAKRGDLASRRRVLGTLRDASVVHVLFTEIAPAFADRNGGYTRIVKVGHRKGDNASLAVIELVEAGAGSAKDAVAEATKVTARSAAGENAGGSDAGVTAEAAKGKASASSGATKSSGSGKGKDPVAKKPVAKKPAAKKPAAKKSDNQ